MDKSRMVDLVDKLERGTILGPLEPAIVKAFCEEFRKELATLEDDAYYQGVTDTMARYHSRRNVIDDNIQNSEVSMMLSSLGASEAQVTRYAPGARTLGANDKPLKTPALKESDLELDATLDALDDDEIDWDFD